MENKDYFRPYMVEVKNGDLDAALSKLRRMLKESKKMHIHIKSLRFEKPSDRNKNNNNNNNSNAI